MANQGGAQLGDIQLTGWENKHEWLGVLKKHLEALGLQKFVFDVVTRPPITHFDDTERWEKRMEVARVVLLATIHRDIEESLEYEGVDVGADANAHEIYNKIICLLDKSSPQYAYVKLQELLNSKPSHLPECLLQLSKGSDRRPLLIRYFSGLADIRSELRVAGLSVSDEVTLEVAVEGVKDCFPDIHADLVARKNNGDLSWVSLLREFNTTKVLGPKPALTKKEDVGSAYKKRPRVD